MVLPDRRLLIERTAKDQPVLDGGHPTAAMADIYLELPREDTVPVFAVRSVRSPALCRVCRRYRSTGMFRSAERNEIRHTQQRHIVTVPSRCRPAVLGDETSAANWLK